MPDKFSKKIRSKIMSKIKSKWTTSEIKIHNILKGNNVKHKMHPNLPGNPDVFLKEKNTIVFIDGCFWHNCPIHGHIPKSNVEYWKNKIERNVQRDKENNKKLEENGFKVVRFWEHEIISKDFNYSKFFKKVDNNRKL